jgi:hypothetical protein
MCIYTHAGTWSRMMACAHMYIAFDYAVTCVCVCVCVCLFVYPLPTLRGQQVMPVVLTHYYYQ